jgi:hypothetical protein
VAYQVEWEWDVEVLDPDLTGISDPDDRDIVDHLFQSSYADCVKVAASDPTNCRIVLVCDIGNDAEGIVERGWAYMDDDGKLQEWATDAYGHNVRKVPKYLLREVSR